MMLNMVALPSTVRVVVAVTTIELAAALQEGLCIILMLRIDLDHVQSVVPDTDLYLSGTSITPHSRSRLIILKLMSMNKTGGTLPWIYLIATEAF